MRSFDVIQTILIRHNRSSCFVLQMQFSSHLVAKKVYVDITVITTSHFKTELNCFSVGLAPSIGQPLLLFPPWRWMSNEPPLLSPSIHCTAVIFHYIFLFYYWLVAGVNTDDDSRAPQLSLSLLSHVTWTSPVLMWPVTPVLFVTHVCREETCESLRGCHGRHGYCSPLNPLLTESREAFRQLMGKGRKPDRRETHKSNLRPKYLIIKVNCVSVKVPLQCRLKLDICTKWAGSPILSNPLVQNGLDFFSIIKRKGYNNLRLLEVVLRPQNYCCKSRKVEIKSLLGSREKTYMILSVL